MARVSRGAAAVLLLVAACALLGCASVAEAAAKQKKKAGVTHKVRWLLQRLDAEAKRQNRTEQQRITDGSIC